tara:strand:+ start:2015 stop:2161 length:147 start_codon:yes stop_codon:yes gene_type:complete
MKGSNMADQQKTPDATPTGHLNDYALQKIAKERGINISVATFTRSMGY